jgi:hypothetical protein
MKRLIILKKPIIVNYKKKLVYGNPIEKNRNYKLNNQSFRKDK